MSLPDIDFDSYIPYRIPSPDYTKRYAEEHAKYNAMEFDELQTIGKKFVEEAQQRMKEEEGETAKGKS